MELQSLSVTGGQNDHGGSGDGAAEPVGAPEAQIADLPRCAGVGIEESKVWLCKECRNALCVSRGVNMPGPALANLMWG